MFSIATLSCRPTDNRMPVTTSALLASNRFPYSSAENLHQGRVPEMILIVGSGYSRENNLEENQMRVAAAAAE